ncbi:uncharacterized protein CLUP02_10608 [Colletotrichum lupini]|uniref:Uncharacterized protein n=1 Tax=Colletotrichum lupini TaxID=145971 RepID=A0A9Q8SYS2_9PEZI|nr:uncharacterized protein CLUP02_10608 [Colletotrichum lupini]UQC85112.1 hypothetical protein CLUP02_10608 [Colletotrichum lupini]
MLSVTVGISQATPPESRLTTNKPQACCCCSAQGCILVAHYEAEQIPHIPDAGETTQCLIHANQTKPNHSSINFKHMWTRYNSAYSMTPLLRQSIFSITFRYTNSISIDNTDPIVRHANRLPSAIRIFHLQLCMAKPQASSLPRSFIQIPVPSLLPYPVCISILILCIHTDAGTSPPPAAALHRVRTYAQSSPQPVPVQVIVIGLQPLLSLPGLRKFPRLSKTTLQCFQDLSLHDKKPKRAQVATAGMFPRPLSSQAPPRHGVFGCRLASDIRQDHLEKQEHGTTTRGRSGTH